MDNYVTVEVSVGGTRTYLDSHGLPHRTDGPAKIRPDGGELWAIHGLLHRDDGPAVVMSDGTRKWYCDGRLHRTDGPAIEHANGDYTWYIHSKSYHFMEWAYNLHKTPEEITILSLQYNTIKPN